MWRKLIIVCSAILLAFQSQALSLKQGYPEAYTVKAKDTLWGIASLYLNSPWQWQRLWQCNPQIHNPHRIYPGDTLHVAIINGQPCLQVGPRTVKLSPSMRVEKSQSAIPPIPLALIEPFLTQSRVMSLKQFLAAPYVIAHQDDHLISTKGNMIYARGLTTRNYHRYVILRREETYIDPVTEKPLGIEAKYIATTALENFADPASLKVLTARDVINEGDRLFPVENHAQAREFIPHVPQAKVNTQIIAILRSISQVGRYDIVALNYGKTAGAKPGQVLTIWRAGTIVTDKYAKKGPQTVRLPAKKIGVLMVFKTFSNVSYALVMQASQAIRILDSVNNR
jgi:hypothetical protein